MLTRSYLIPIPPLVTFRRGDTRKYNTYQITNATLPISFRDMRYYLYPLQHVPLVCEVLRVVVVIVVVVVVVVVVDTAGPPGLEPSVEIQ